jgi:hypothetical protein
MSASYTVAPILPEAPRPVLSIAATVTNAIILSWQGGGFVLESSTNLSGPLSFPFGPWHEVSGLQNPYYHLPDAPFRAFRLKKK